MSRSDTNWRWRWADASSRPSMAFIVRAISVMVAVVGISASSRADLLAELDRLGTNLLQVARGATRAARRPRCPRRRRR